jgi:hypothetical protein
MDTARKMAWLWFLGAAFVADGAMAQDASATAAPPRDRDDAAAPPPEAAPRMLHGMYIRGGLGFGGMGNDVVGSAEGADGEKPEATITAMGVMTEATLALALSNEWALGVGAWNGLVFASDYTHVRGEEIPQSLRKPESFTVTGFFGDWLFVPALGLHAQAGIGLALLATHRYDVLRDRELGDSSIAAGPGATVGVGADFWLDAHWALGAMARLTAGAAFERDSAHEYLHGVVTPGLLATVCYNE